MINKKNTILISTVLTLSILIINYFGAYEVCVQDRDCTRIIVNLIQGILIFIPILILSLITYKMREEIFRSWLKFAYIWVPLTVLITFLAPEYDASLVSITKGVVSFSMSVLFLLVSFIIILVKYRKNN